MTEPTQSGCPRVRPSAGGALAAPALAAPALAAHAPLPPSPLPPWRARWAGCSAPRARAHRRRGLPARPASSRRPRGRATPTTRWWTSWKRPSRWAGQPRAGAALSAPAPRSPQRGASLPLPQACFASLVSQDYVNGTDQEEIRTGEPFPSRGTLLAAGAGKKPVRECPGSGGKGAVCHGSWGSVGLYWRALKCVSGTREVMWCLGKLYEAVTGDWKGQTRRCFRARWNK